MNVLGGGSTMGWPGPSSGATDWLQWGGGSKKLFTTRGVNPAHTQGANGVDKAR
jgi:hypothetical protein